MVLQQGKREKMGKHKQSVLEPSIITGDVPTDREMVSVLMLNDDDTTCGYVVFCLLEVDFGLTYREAEEIMFQTHIFGDSIVVIIPRKIAVKLLKDVAKLNLRCGQSLRFKIQ